MVKIPSFERSFASHLLVRYWGKRNKCLPKDVFKSSHTKYYFDCDKCNHESLIGLHKMHKKEYNCVFCSSKTNQKMCYAKDCLHCFNRSFASNPLSIKWSKKNKVSPREVFKTSSNQYLFDCDKCNHEFSIQLDFIERYDSFCNFCSGKRLCENEECYFCFNASFASHPKSEFFSKKNEISPRNIFQNSHTECIFDCDNCGHEFKSALNQVSNPNRNAWCPFCAHKQICEVSKNCSICFEASFGFHELANQWSKLNKISSPFEIYKNSHELCFFDCTKCNHTFSSPLSWITRGNKCNYCGHRKLCESPDCDFCFKVSFASHYRSEWWSKKNECSPRDVVKNSNEKYIFDCNKCKRDFSSRLNSINYMNSWCPYCRNKTERKLYDILITKHPSLVHQFKVDWAKNKKHLPYDFVIPEYKIIIELDGIQHFIQVSNWDSPEETFENDIYKEKCANDNGYSIIRILQEDIFKDKYDWLSELNKNILEIVNSKKIKNIYMCKNNEYSKFIEV